MPPIRITRQSSKYPPGKLPLSKTRVRKSLNIACEFPGCTRTFPQRCNYRDHMNVHEGKRPHACPDCESAFASRGGLTRHQKKYHNYVPIRHRQAKKLSTKVDDNPSSFDIEVARAPSPAPSGSGDIPRWINLFAPEGSTSTFPTLSLEPVPTPSPSESSISGSSNLYASLLSSWGPTSQSEPHYDYASSGYSLDSQSMYPSTSTWLHYDYSQSTFASQPTYDFAPYQAQEPSASSSSFALTPNYSHWSSHAGQDSELSFQGNSTYSDVLNLDHYQYQYSTPMNYSY